MKTTTKRTAAAKKAANIKVLEAAFNVVEHNLRGATGSERNRLQGEANAIREQLRSLGA